MCLCVSVCFLSVEEGVCVCVGVCSKIMHAHLGES